MLTPEQVLARREGIGSSDVAALVGKGPRTRQMVFNEKVYGAEQKREDWLDYGSHAESGIIAYRVAQLGAYRWQPQDFQKAFGPRLVCPGIVRGHESMRALATPDAIASGVFGDIGIEAKNVAFDNSGEWGEEDEDCPEHHWLQCQWQMGVTDLHRWELVAAIGGRPPAVWPIEYRPQVYEDLLVVVEDFWERYVIPKQPPGPIDGSDAASEYLRRAYPKELHGVLARATPEEEALALAYVAAADTEKAGKAAQGEARNRLCALLGDRLGVVLSDGRRATWKWQDGKNGPTRVLRVSKGR